MILDALLGFREKVLTTDYSDICLLVGPQIIDRVALAPPTPTILNATVGRMIPSLKAVLYPTHFH